MLLLRELLRAAAEGDSSLKAASIIEQIVSNRLSSEASEKRLEKASEHKHVVDLSCDNFIMTRVHPIMCTSLQFNYRSELLLPFRPSLGFSESLFFMMCSLR